MRSPSEEGGSDPRKNRLEKQPSALKRLTRSVSRIGSRRRARKVREQNVDEPSRPMPTMVEQLLPSQAHQQNEEERAARYRAPVLQADSFSAVLKDMLRIDIVVQKSQKALMAAEKLTKSLKDQAEAAQEIAKMHTKRDLKPPPPEGSNKFRTFSEETNSIKLDFERMRMLHEIEDLLGQGEVDAAFEAIWHAHSSVLNSIADMATPKSRRPRYWDMTSNIIFLSELERLKGLLVKDLLQQINSATSADACFLKASELLGRALGNRSQVKCILDLHARALKTRLSSDVVSLSSCCTNVTDKHVVEFAAQVTSNICHTWGSMVLETKSLLDATLPDDAIALAKAMFKPWLLQSTREVTEVLLRLVIFPIAAPRELPVTACCLSAFLTYCKSIENFMGIPVCDTATYALLEPVASILERKKKMILSQAVEWAKTDVELLTHVEDNADSSVFPELLGAQKLFDEVAKLSMMVTGIPRPMQHVCGASIVLDMAKVRCRKV